MMPKPAITSSANPNEGAPIHGGSLETFLGDLRFGFRMLYKDPSFSVIVLLTLALGIGANTAIFSVIDTVLLHPLPYRDAERIALITEYNAKTNMAQAGVSYPDYTAWAKQTKAFEEMAAYWNVSGDGAVLGGIESTERVDATMVSPNFFSMLGIDVARGRAFVPEEERPGAPKAFLISDALWRRSFGARPDAIGKTYLVDDENATLVGVLPRGFQFPEKCDLWLATGAMTNRQFMDHISHPFWVLAKLRPGVTLQAAQTDLDRIQGQLGLAFPATDANWRVRSEMLLDQLLGNARRSLLLIFGAVGFVLLIACANVVNLLLARASVRQREFAIRVSLGAGRNRLLRQTLTETLLIVAISAVFALVIAKVALAAIMVAGVEAIPRLRPFKLNGSVLAFTGFLIVAITLFVGVSPALAGWSASHPESLREGQRSGGVSFRSWRLRNILVITEVALTFLLLCGAGLVIKSFARLTSVNPGFDSENLVTMKITLPGMRYPKPEQRRQLLQRLIENLQTLPGIRAVGATNVLPLSGDTAWGAINIEGHPVEDWAGAPTVEGRSVSASYFHTMGIPLLKGRIWRRDEDPEAVGVVVINKAMADHFWPGQDPIGQHVTELGHQTTREVIGIVGNVKDFGLAAESEPALYGSYNWWPSINLVFRSTADPYGLENAVRRKIAEVEKDVPVYQVTTVRDLVDHSEVSQRFSLFLLALFATLALILSAVGIFGLLAFSVSQRRHEMGVRLALGAHRQNILWLILWQGMQLVLVGLLLGAIGSFVLTRALTSLLYDIRPFEPFTLASVAIVLAGVGLVACYIPSRIAMKVDPIVALRYE